LTNIVTQLRQFASITLGGVVSQLAALCGSLLVTRLFAPSAIGEFAIYSSMVVLLTPLLSLTLPAAIVLTTNETDADALSRVVLQFAVFLAVLLLVAVILSSDLRIVTPAYVLAPIGACVGVISLLVQQRLLRDQENRAFGLSVALQSIAAQMLKVCAGMVGLITSSALIIATIVGTLLPLLKRAAGLPIASIKQHWRDDLVVVRRYGEFLRHQLPQQLLNAAAQALPVVLLSSLSSVAAAGYYSIAMLVLSMPSQMIGRFLGEAFYGHIARLSAQGDADTSRLKLRRQWMQMTVGMLLVAIGPFAIIVWFGPFLFSQVFGPVWSASGEFASVMAIWFLLTFANSPSLKILMVQRDQRWATLLNVLTLPVRAVALWVGLAVYEDSIIAISWFAVVGVVHNLALYGLAYRSLERATVEQHG
jgi:O-antigen/teichoic acid export membrane protein